MNTSASSLAEPLETLAIQQLAFLIQDEKLLATKYPVLNSEQNSPEQREAFSVSLAELRRRADRLQRYVDALDSFGLVTPSFAS